MPVSLVGWSSRKIRRKVRSSLGAECSAFSTGLEHTDLIRILWAELSGDLKELDRYEDYLRATEAIALNVCKSVADALLNSGSAASKTSEDKRLGVEMTMIKQKLVRNETRFPWVEAELMPADVLTKGRELGARFQMKPTEETLERRKSKREAKAKASEDELIDD